MQIYEQEYLARVKFRTSYGKKLAGEGRKYAKEFLLRLREELDS